MTAVWMRLRTELRNKWKGWFAVAMAAGLGCGVIVAAAAGARRTDSALARHLAAYRFPDVIITEGDEGVRGEIARLPPVETSAYLANLAYVARDANNRPLRPVGPRALKLEMSAEGRDGVTLRRWKLLAGRAPNPRRMFEALVDSRAAETFGVDTGDVIPVRVFHSWETVDLDLRGDPQRIRVGTLVELRVVGINAATDTVNYPGGVVRLTPAFFRAHQTEQRNSAGWLLVRLRRGAADVPAFRSRIDDLTGGAFYVQRDEARKIQRPIHLQVRALWLAILLGAVLAFVLVAQALARMADEAAGMHPTLRAVGMTSRQLFAIGVARGGAIAVLAAGIAVGVATALSPLTPIGRARELEPAPGFAIDPLVLALGGGTVVVAVLLAGALASARVARASEAEPRSDAARPRTTAAETLARWGAPVTIVMGVRLALARKRGGTTVAVGATLTGGILAVAAAVTALTLSASLNRLLTTPRLYGQNWDYTIHYGGLYDRQELAASFQGDPSISGAALGTEGALVRVNGREVPVRAVESLKGTVSPTVIEGRAPAGPREILLGAKTLDALDVQLEDVVEVRQLGSEDDGIPMRVVGRGVVGGETSPKLGEGGSITFRALREIYPEIPQNCCALVELRFVPGAEREATLARYERRFADPPPPVPSDVVDLGGLEEVPFALTVLLVALAAAALAHVLLVATRRRRRDLAILKTLGFDRRQVVATVAWQATTFAAVGLLLGAPLGLAAGRWAWTLFAGEVGFVPEPVTPGLLILLVFPAAVLLAHVVAAVPAHIAAKTRPAVVLRAE